MNRIEKKLLIESIKDFDLPEYNEIPNVGLYLEQTAKYISEYLKPILETPITGSMISNYVKKGLVLNPIKKQYNREQIAYLFFIAVAKSVISMEDIKLLLNLQSKVYKPEVAFNYFQAELENVLGFVFETKDTIDEIGSDQSEEKMILRNIIVAVAHKVYIDKCFKILHEKTKE